MRILVTAGGTRAPIDEVRWLGNVSRGAFGARITKAALARGAHVVHLHAADAQAPHELRLDLRGDSEVIEREWRKAAKLLADSKDRYRPIPFEDFEDYARTLERLLRDERFEVVILAAAVSDYAPRSARRGKIASGPEELVLDLVRVPKLIARVKEWAPGVFLVGFKLLVGVPPEELIRVALESGRATRSDVTVANDLALVRAGRHAIHLVRDGRPTETYDHTQNPAERLVERVLEWQRERTERSSDD